MKPRFYKIEFKFLCMSYMVLCDVITTHLLTLFVTSHLSIFHHFSCSEILTVPQTSMQFLLLQVGSVVVGVYAMSSLSS